MLDETKHMQMEPAHMRCSALGLKETPVPPQTLESMLELVDIDLSKQSATADKSDFGLVQVLYAGVNIDDIHLQEHTMVLPVSPTPSKDNLVVPGMELSGVILQNFGEFKAGDRVVGIKPCIKQFNGTWSEKCYMKAAWLAKIPDHLSLRQAAAGGICGAAVVACLKQSGMYRLVKDADIVTEKLRVIVVGAGGGIGTLMTMTLKRMSQVEEIVAVCSDRSSKLCLECGATRTVNYEKVNEIEQLAKGMYDVVFDFVGGTQVEALFLPRLKSTGVFATMNGPTKWLGDEKPSFLESVTFIFSLFYRLLWNRIAGSHAWYRKVDVPPDDSAGTLLREAMHILARFGIVPIVDVVAHFRDESSVKKAIDKVRNHRAHGKVLISFDAKQETS